jgi:hypothetical protein
MSSGTLGEHRETRHEPSSGEEVEHCPRDELGLSTNIKYPLVLGSVVCSASIARFPVLQIYYPPQCHKEGVLLKGVFLIYTKANNYKTGVCRGKFRLRNCNKHVNKTKTIKNTRNISLDRYILSASNNYLS